MFLALSAKSQGTFTISGTITEHPSQKPVDHSIGVKIFTETGKQYITFCNDDGQYAFTLSDSLNGKKVVVAYFQDETRMLREHFNGPCSVDCDISPGYWCGTDMRKIIINTDSVKTYTVNFTASRLLGCGIDFPTFYFKKNKIQITQIAGKDTTDAEAICALVQILQCKKKFAIEIGGHCSKAESDKQNLSLKRAQFMKDTLVKLGINPGKLVIKGYADTKPAELRDMNEAVIGLKGPEECQRVVFHLIRMDFKE